MAEATPPWTRVFLRCSTEEICVEHTPTGIAAIFSRPCPPGESENEDAAGLVVLEGGRAVLAVADGAGGQPSGEEAAALALGAVVRHASAVTPEESLASAILAGLDEANRAVIGMGVGAATTLALVGIEADLVRPYHAGDSEVLITGQRGKLKLQTLSHSPTGYAVEAGLLDAEDALAHEERHLVTNLVGSEDMRIDIGPVVRLRPRDTLVVGSDGLFDNVTAGEIAERIRTGPLDEAARKLATLAVGRMSEARPGEPHKPDDLTFILYRHR